MGVLPLFLSVFLLNWNSRNSARNQPTVTKAWDLILKTRLQTTGNVVFLSSSFVGCQSYLNKPVARLARTTVNILKENSCCCNNQTLFLSASIRFYERLCCSGSSRQAAQWLMAGGSDARFLGKKNNFILLCNHMCY